jgi:ABC-type Fe3+-siderophore transport system permease subunit
VVVRPLELPVGVITALVGVPVFALLLRRSVA